jgi:hypothetical protein
VWQAIVVLVVASAMFATGAYAGALWHTARRRLALLAIVGFGVLGVGFAPSAAISAPRVAACGGGYVSAHLSWGNKCLRAGEFCKVGNREYVRYGFVCPSSGHLRRR